MVCPNKMENEKSLQGLSPRVTFLKDDFVFWVKTEVGEDKNRDKLGGSCGSPGEMTVA